MRRAMAESNSASLVTCRPVEGRPLVRYPPHSEQNRIFEGFLSPPVETWNSHYNCSSRRSLMLRLPGFDADCRDFGIDTGRIATSASACAAMNSANKTPPRRYSIGASPLGSADNLVLGDGPDCGLCHLPVASRGRRR